MTATLPDRSTAVPEVVAGTRPGTWLRLPTVLLYLGLHVLLGVAGLAVPAVATFHAVVVSAVLLAHLLASRRIERIAGLTAYAAMGDVFWRMTGSRAPWELSKYLLLAGGASVLLRFVHRWRHAVGPLGLVAVLVPGIVAGVVTLGPAASRDAVASSDLGLISLGVAALALRQLVATEVDLWNLVWVMLGPVAAALAVTTWSTFTAADLQFSDESNFAITGGFGPNQVSTLLGLGILLCLLAAYQRRGPGFLVLEVVLGLWLTWATFLTFSRGGMYSLVLAATALVLSGLGTRGVRARSVATLAVGVLGIVVVFASANDFSGSWLETRYSQAGEATTGRASLAEQDLSVFGEHPWLGVGTGLSPTYHEGANLAGAAAHTEYTRLLAEHGLLGATAIAVVVGMVAVGWRRARSQANRLLVAGAGVWALTTMLHSATRIAAVGLVFALTQLRVEPDGPGRRGGAPRDGSASRRQSGARGGRSSRPHASRASAPTRSR